MYDLHLDSGRVYQDAKEGCEPETGCDACSSGNSMCIGSLQQSGTAAKCSCLPGLRGVGEACDIRKLWQAYIYVLLLPYVRV